MISFLPFVLVLFFSGTSGFNPVSFETENPGQSPITTSPNDLQGILALPDGVHLVNTTNRFRLVATPKSSGLAKSLSSDVENIRNRIVADLGQDYEGITEIRIADRPSSFQALQPKTTTAPSWAAGIAWPSLNLIVLNAGHGRRPSEIKRTLAHEISHIALGRLAPRAFPRWFLEGMATYHSEDWRFSNAGTLAGAVLRDNLIPLQDLDKAWPDTPAEVRLAYAQANDFVSWFFRHYGREAVHQLIEEVVNGNTFTNAIEIGTGLPLWKLEYEWRQALPFRYTWMPAITSGGFIWGIMTFLFIFVYLRKRQTKQRRLATMEAEESWLHHEDEEEEQKSPSIQKSPKNEMNGSASDPNNSVPW